MFSLVHGLYRELTYVPERRVVFLGLGGAGKSSVLEWAKQPVKSGQAPEALSKMSPTVGLNVYSLRMPGQKVLMWDLGGDVKLRPIWEPYVKQADAVVWVVDCSDASSIGESAAVLREIVNRPHLLHRPLLVLANKQDVKGAVDPVHLAVRLDIPAAADIRSQCVQPTSAATGAGIRDGVEWLAEQLAEPAQLSAAYKTCIK